MQVELAMEDKGLQTSPRDDDIKPNNQQSFVYDIVENVAGNIVSDIVQRLPIKIEAQTQETATEIIPTTEQGSQTLPIEGLETISHVEESSDPYEIHIRTSFVIPEKANERPMDSSVQQKSRPIVMEIQKSFVIDDTKPGFVHELETQDNTKKSKLKRKKHKKTNLVDSGSTVEPKKIDDEQGFHVEKFGEKSTQPTYATIQITKTTVYETSNLISNESHPNIPCLIFEDAMAEDNADVSLTPGNEKKNLSQYLRNNKN